ncbi:MAG TPA: carboxypeptidase regulatory-like domain-containing protein [Pyrinomonadaceae bacterium]
MKKIAFPAAALLFCVALLAASISAQQITATVTGTVTDQAGAVVPGATVTATSAETGLTKTATTNEDGQYTIPFLQPGSYNITVAKDGFAPVNRENIKLEVAQTASIDTTLAVTGAQVQVDVSSDETPLLQTETSNLETTIEQKLVEDLPSAERNIFAFVNLVPGTIDTNIALGNPNSAIGSSANRNFFDSNFAVNGGRASTNDVLLDGVTNTIGDFNGVTISPPQDAIREFKVVSGVAPADYGRTGGGIVTISSKSGTQRFHGSLYEYYQDGNFNANGWQRNRLGQRRINELSRHQFGGAIGGPLYFLRFGDGDGGFFDKLDRTFFFANYEARREKNPFTRTITVPTQRMRTGDLGELLLSTPLTNTTATTRTTYACAANNPSCAVGTPVLNGQIFNPFGALVPYTQTVTNIATGASTTTTVQGRPLIAGNNLSTLSNCAATGGRAAACLDPVALAVLRYIPAPNQSGLINNYTYTGTTDFTRDIFAARLDHTISERQSIFGRFSYEKRHNAPPNYFGTEAAFISVVDDKFYNTTINHVFSFRPNLINNLRVGFTRAAARQGPESFGFDPTSLGLPQYLRQAASALIFPSFTIGGGSEGLTPAGELTSSQIGGSGNNQARDTHNISDSVTWVTGKHTFRFGAEYRLYKFYPYQFGTAASPTGSFSFNRITTRGPVPSVSPTVAEAAGSSLASFFLGIPSGITQEISTPITIFHHYGAGYVQDDWKIFRRLTLNLGLRWDFETPTASPQQLVTTFDEDALAPIAGGVRTNIQATPLDAAVGTLNPGINDLTGFLSFPEGAQMKTNFDRFAPRLGFAYGINNKTTLRGGFGMFFLPISLEPVTAVGTNFTNSQTQTSFNTGTGQVTAGTVFLTNPFPNGLQSATGSSLGAFTQLGNTITVVEPERPNPLNMQWNLVLQRELAKNLVVDVAYVGSSGRNLPTRDIQLNQLSPDVIEYARGEVAAGRAASISAFLSQQVSNPLRGQISAVGGLNGNTIARAQLLRRFPQYQAVTLSRPHIGKSNYNALQVNLQKRFSDGWSALANYTWSKLLDTGGVGNGAAFTDPTNTDDIFNYDEEYSYSTLDVPHRFTLSSSYELPFGRGRRFGKDWNGFTNAIFGGWQISGTAVFQTGAPLTITYSGFLGTGLTGVGNAQRRPNLVGGVDPMFENFDERVRQGLPVFNVEAFSAPSDVNYEFGSAARTNNNIRRDNYRNVDLSILKNVLFNEGKQKLQLRAEVLNVFNWTVFGTPGTQFGSNTFGVITTQGNRPRLIQLVGRFTF